MRPHGKNFTNSRDKTPSTQAKSNPRRRSKNFIASCKQSLQRVTGSKPSKGTNALPPTWKLFLSLGRSCCKGHQVLGRHFGRATGKAREAISRPHGSEGMPFSQAFFWLPLHQRPCEGSGWRTAPSDATSPKAVLSPTRTLRRTTTKPGTAPAPETLRHPYRLGDITEADPPRALLALLKYPFYSLFILDNGMNLISKSLTILTPA